MEIKRKKLFSAALAILIALLTFQGGNAIHYTGEGLDPSWKFGINFFNYEGIRFGRDVVFTYGPLGFLSNALNVGENIVITLVFWAVLSVISAVLLYVLIKSHLDSMPSMIKLGIGLLLYLMSFEIDQRNPETFIVFWYIASLLMSISSRYSRKTIIFGDALLILSIFIKFTMIIEVMSCVLLTVAAMILTRQKGRMHVLAHTGGAIMTAFSGYLLFYDHSIMNLYYYIRGSLEYSLGYNYAMSSVKLDKYLTAVIIMVILYLAAMYLNLNNRNNLILFFSLAGPSFFFYKHGFVRSDHVHVSIFFWGMMVILSLMALFYDNGPGDELKLKFVPGKAIGRYLTIAICTVMFILAENFTKVKITDFFQPWWSRSAVFSDILNEKPAPSNGLPDKMREMIGDDTVAIYPTNILYNRNLDLNYVPLYGVQAYGIYTPWLDEKTAQRFVREDRPEHIVLELGSIDNRWSFIETPQTWWAIKNHYYVEYYENGKFLLSKRENPLVNDMTLVQTKEVHKEDTIIVSGYDYFKIKTRISYRAAVKKIISKIPEVNMTVTYSDGSSETHRVILQNFEAGVDLSSVVASEAQCADYLNRHGDLSKVDSVSFSGKGLDFFDETFVVEFYIVDETGE